MIDGNDFKSIYDDMKIHGMPLPAEKVFIQIPNAKTILENCFKYVLSLQNAEFMWQPEYDEVAKWFGNNQGRGLFLFGDCGRGKSLLSRYVIPAILLKYMKKVVTVYDIQEMNAKIDEVMKKHIISLDDIGTEELSVNYGNKRLAFAEIMDSVEKHGKLVIVSTNLKKDAIIERYGERIYDRIISTTYRIEFKGNSLRK
jgi:DNA replication protein DnaC